MRPHFAELITEAQKESLETLAETRGLDAEELLRRIVDEGIEKLEHLDRCKPRGGKTTGRPFNSPQATRVGELVKTLTSIYTKLHEQHGGDFEALFGEQERELQAAVEEKDLGKLEEFEGRKPWILRKW